MHIDAFIKVTFAVHKLINMLPPEEDLKGTLLECADSILVDLVLLWQEGGAISSEQKSKIGGLLFSKIDALQGYFSRAQSGNWIDPKNFLMLEGQYSKIKALAEELMSQLDTQRVREESSETSQTAAVTDYRSAVPLKDIKERSLSERQRRIIELLKNKEKIQVWELQKILPQVTKRTLRRDLDDLLEQNLIERLGEWNHISYRIRAGAVIK